jgi:lipid-A-disaccharide synthase
LRIRRQLFEHFSAHPPEIFLGIDSPDFNLRLEMQLRARGVTTAHLVSPSVWAWRQGRIRTIKRAVDLMLCLFPFETGVYARHGVPAQFVGHPLADEIEPRADRAAARRALGIPPDARLVALLPGSRGAEVRLLAPLFLQAADLLRQANSGLSFIIPAASRERAGELERLLVDHASLGVTLVSGRSREVITASDAALLGSGTATLEAALLRRPMVVAYRMAPLSWLVLKRLVRVSHAALPNILAGRALVPELLQGEATPLAMAEALQPLLADGAAVTGQLQEFDRIHSELRQGYAVRAAAALAALVPQRGAC